MDWSKLKREYIAGGTSYRKLAEKHGVSFSTLRKVAAKEGWTELRDKARAKADTKLTDLISDQQAERFKRLQDVTDMLLDNLENIVTKVTLEEMILDKYTLKQITGALKDIKDIQNIKSGLDLEEQKARIAILKKQAESDDDSDTAVKITIEGGDEEWQS